jgi:hypothetical protein
MATPGNDELNGIAAPNCVSCLTPMHLAGEDPDGADAHWACNACGLVNITG